MLAARPRPKAALRLRRQDRRCGPPAFLAAASARAMNGLAQCALPRPGPGRTQAGAEIIAADHGAGLREVRAVVKLQGVVRIGRLSCAGAPRARCLMCLHSSPVRPSRRLRLLSCLRAVECSALPPPRRMHDNMRHATNGARIAHHGLPSTGSTLNACELAGS
jgi:hypothetical protein